MNNQSLLLLVWCGTIISCVVTIFIVWLLLSGKAPRTSKHLFYSGLLVSVAAIVISCIWKLYDSAVNYADTLPAVEVETDKKTSSSAPVGSGTAKSDGYSPTTYSQVRPRALIMPDGSPIQKGLWTVWVNSVQVPSSEVVVERRDDYFKIILSYGGRRIQMLGNETPLGISGVYPEDEKNSFGKFDLTNQSRLGWYTADFIGSADFLQGKELRVILP